MSPTASSSRLWKAPASPRSRPEPAGPHPQRTTRLRAAAGGFEASTTGTQRNMEASMGLLHRHHDIGGTRYQMREKLFAIGDDFWIETENGDKVFKVNGKALRARATFILESPSGEELFKIQEKKLTIRDTMKVERDGDTVAKIK